jgi:hypothetical protein
VRDAGHAGRILGEGGVTVDAARTAIQRVIEPDADPPGPEVPFTPSARETLQLLLALLRQDDSVASRCFSRWVPT